MRNTMRQLGKERLARIFFWGAMSSAVVTAASGSFAVLPDLLTWLSGTATFAFAASLAITVSRMPRAARTLWSLVGAWGLLLVFVSLTV